ncbi:MAG TPA: hypothetical protein PKE25_00375 [Novosphingobium sp.]|nr:hypothetical protein [Novosphingobium sp.]
MNWSMVRIEPLRPRAAGLTVCCLCLYLPLIRDGRVSWVHLVRAPERAGITRHYADQSHDRGEIRLIDNQLTCIWRADDGIVRPALRLIASSFALGEKVGLRASGKVIELFRVCELIPASRVLLAR